MLINNSCCENTMKSTVWGPRVLSGDYDLKGYQGKDCTKLGNRQN